MPTTGSPPTLTRKGQSTRNRIVVAAASLIHERNVATTTIEDVKAAAEVSGSQMYHYFADKDQLVEAVIDHQADTIIQNQRDAELGTVPGLRAWRDAVVHHARGVAGRGGCPLGSLGGQLAETDAQARDRLADGFGRWSTALRDGLRELDQQGRLVTDANGLAVTLLATLQGGLLLAQISRDIHPLETALDTLLGLAVTGWSDAVPTL